ncbi:hypothetical protein EC988_001110, partial [Linderina pennispora]
MPPRLGSQWRKAALSTCIYLFISLALTLHNKMVLQWYQFSFPWLVTATHSLGGIVGTQIMQRLGTFTPVRLDKQQQRILWQFSVLYTVNIAVSNISLNFVTIPFHQVVRGTVPVFTLAITALSGGDPKLPILAYVSLVPVVMGVGLATYGDYSWTVVGLLLTLLGTVLAAVKTVVTNRILVGRLQLKLGAFDLLYRLSPLALAQTLAWSLVTGEFAQARAFMTGMDSVWPLLGALAANGAIAFVLNIASFTASKNTSALAMTVTGNVKVVLTVVLGCILFSVQLSYLSMLGITITLL